jgi:hypothetical protein
MTCPSLTSHDGITQFLPSFVAKRSNCLMLLRNDPRLEPIRQHPRFPVLLSRVGLDDVAVASYKR